ncbi:ice-binding family protein [Aquisphaera insulae]|uniref:ice-binding family protein n=1 Tax=Aquisphaera insulae TaxID=2712864 RepID=UPI0013EC11BC|nr:ice-binding family protein [Aquisphaera insulae]
MRYSGLFRPIGALGRAILVSPSTRSTRTRIRASHPAPELLERRLALTASPTGLGAAAHFAILGLQGTPITSVSTIVGNVGVSPGGSLWNPTGSTVTGNVTLSAAGQMSGTGKVLGAVTVDPAAVCVATSAALNASTQYACLPAGQTFGSIVQATTVAGRGGVNVVNVNGNISSSLTLSGTSADIFIVNVSGNLTLTGGSGLKLAGGVTPNHVVYNFTASRSTLTIVSPGVTAGTLLAPHGQVILTGTCNGAVIAGGSSVSLLPGARVNEVDFEIPTVTPAATTTSTVAAAASKPTANLDGLIVPLVADSSGNGVIQTTKAGRR